MQLVIFVIMLITAFSSVAQQYAAPMWQEGMYWTFYAEVYEEILKERVLRDFSEVTFLAVKGTGLLWTETWAIAVITYNAPLFIVIYTQEWLGLYIRWPLPVEFIPIPYKPDPQRGFFIALASIGLPYPLVPSPEPTINLASNGIEIEIREEGKSVVNTSYGTFYDAVGIKYSAKVGQWRRDGMAWWADQLKWWVKAEGYELDEYGGRLHYLVVLKEHGVLAPEELNAKLREAFKYTIKYYPDMAEMLQQIFDQLQIPVFSR